MSSRDGNDIIWFYWRILIPWCHWCWRFGCRQYSCSWWFCLCFSEDEVEEFYCSETLLWIKCPLVPHVDIKRSRHESDIAHVDMKEVATRTTSAHVDMKENATRATSLMSTWRESPRERQSCRHEGSRHESDIDHVDMKEVATRKTSLMSIWKQELISYCVSNFYS